MLGVRRGLAAAAAICMLLSAGLLATSVVATRRLSLGGYVSEAAIGSQAGTYRLSLWLAAAALILLGVALGPETVLAAGLFLLAALGAGLSSAVTCTTGCPLPPYEPSTLADLVHAGASVIAVSAVALGIVALAWLGEQRRLRVLARVGAAVIVPLIAAMGFGLLALGRSAFTGAVERATLTALTLWVVLASLAVALPPRRTGGD